MKDMLDKPLLSIVIPTKDRYVYIKVCVLTLLELKKKYANIEIVVQDNTKDNTEFLMFLEQEKLDQIMYYHTREVLSVVDNCNLGISHATGEYVCMIGDDDSVTDAIVDVVNWMKINSIDSCLGNLVRYNWPDLQYKHHRFPDLTIPHKKYSMLTIDPKKELQGCLQEGAFQIRRLPRVYHGVVARTILEKVRSQTGCYFPGPSPDMANAVALCMNLGKHVVVNIPIIIDGFCYKSTGGMGTRGAHIGQIENMTHLPKKTAVLWESKIVKYWTAETIYAESTLKALRACGIKAEKYFLMFNYIASYAAFVSYNRHFWKLILPYISLKKDMISLLYYCLRILKKRGRNYILNFFKTRMRITKDTIRYDIKSLSDAVDFVNQFYIANKSKALGKYE
ncbi:hypothetical protein GCM10007042_40520 [Butyricimonas paravirosa]|nr:hypothetical protein GCM10007042_40520 [Butyricimonas paravirosa]